MSLGPNIFHRWPRNQLIRALLYDSYMDHKICRLNWQRNTDRSKCRKMLPVAQTNQISELVVRDTVFLRSYNSMLLLTNCEVIRENIRTAVLKYGPNEVRFVRKTKVQIFSRMDRTNWSIRALLYSHNQRPKPSSNSTLNVFVSSPVSSLNAVVGR